MVLHGPLWDLVGDHRYGIYVVHGPAAATFLPAGRPDRWVYSFGWDPARERLADYKPGRLTERLRVSTGAPRLEVRLGRVGAFSFVGGVAERYRHGRAFLLGDAAHRVTPRGGTGLNTAVADGFDLGWKLAWVMRGWADPSLLDSYEAERRQVAEHNLQRSLDRTGSRRPAVDEVHVDLGPRLQHLWLGDAAGRPGAGPRRSTLDPITNGLTVISANPDAPFDASWGSRRPRATHQRPPGGCHDRSCTGCRVRRLGGAAAGRRCDRSVPIRWRGRLLRRAPCDGARCRSRPGDVAPLAVG